MYTITTHHQGTLTLQYVHTGFVSRENCGLDSSSCLPSETDGCDYLLLFTSSFFFLLNSFIFVFVGKLNQKGSLHSVLNTGRDAVTWSFAKNKHKFLCEPPYVSSPLVQPHNEKMNRLSKNLGKFQYNISMRNLCRCLKQLVKLFLSRFKPLILSDTATIFSRFSRLYIDVFFIQLHIAL